MKKYKTVRGKQYAIHSPTEGNVETLTGEIITSFYGNDQSYFISPTNEINIPDDAVCVPMFPLLAEKFIHKFGNKHNLPSGYIPAYFLKFIDNNGGSMNTQIKPTVNTGVWGDIISSSRWVESYSTSSLRWSAPAYGTNTGFFYFSGTWRAMSITADTPYISTLNWKNVRNSYGQVIARVQRLNDGTTKELGLTPIEATATANAQLFYYNNSTIRQVKFSENDKITHDLIPAIDNKGNACMFNKITKKPFYKSSSTALDYIIGLTAEQARLLYKLPTVTNKTLYISLPLSVFDADGYIIDADINSALNSAMANGWNFQVQYYEDFTEDYLSAYFLESATKQYIDTLFSPTEKTEILFEAQTDRTSYLFANCNANHDEDPDKRIWMTSTYTSSGYGASFLAFGTYTITTQKFDGVYAFDKNIYGIKNGTVTYGGIERTIGTVQPFSGGPTITIFRHRRDTSTYVIRYWWCNISEDNKPVRAYIPCIAPDGTACMWDKITQTPYYNVNTAATGDFRVGLTIEQAKQLYKLPSTGGTLKISLPSSVFDENGDITYTNINKAMAIASAKGWNFEIQNY